MMNETINDGREAFPRPHSVFPSGNIEHGSAGMTLRDYFAAAAMQGLLAYAIHSNPNADVIAEWAYEQADAMLSARERKELNRE